MDNWWVEGGDEVLVEDGRLLVEADLRGDPAHGIAGAVGLLVLLMVWRWFTREEVREWLRKHLLESASLWDSAYRRALGARMRELR